jgi:flagellar hook protein FlgE
MMRSLFSGVTGLRTHQTRMDVLGNNISNVSTIGYKKSVSNFSDLYSQTLSASQAPSGALGSVNAQQIGLGTGVNSITVKHMQGTPQYTGNTTDLAITGDGFFVLNTPEGLRYSRAGDFKVGTTGYLENQNGYYVQGYGSTYQVGNNGKVIPAGLNKANGTNLSGFKFTQDATATTTDMGSYTFDMALNYNNATPPVFQDITMQMYRDLNMISDDQAIYTWSSAGVNGGVDPVTDGGFLDGETYYLDIQGFGRLEFTVDGGGSNLTLEQGYGQMQSALSNIELNVENNNGFIPINKLGNIRVDKNYFTNVTITQDGSVVAQVVNDGIPEGFPNAPYMRAGERVVLGYVALAQFNNYEGLEKVSSNMFQQTPASGNARFSRVGEDGAGTVTPGSLEMSNVDLSEEMVSMITTQRGFQANSRIITTSDTLLEELVNLKR